MIYITDNQPDIYKIANKFGMSIEELKQINGLKSSKLQPFRPIRVRSDGKNIIAPETFKLIESGKYNHLNREYDIQLVSKLENIGEIEETETEIMYTVMPKNTIFSIAKHFGISADELMDLNGLVSPEIKVGQKLIIRKK
jgi:LysM repeat protein